MTSSFMGVGGNSYGGGLYFGGRVNNYTVQDQVSSIKTQQAVYDTNSGIAVEKTAQNAVIKADIDNLAKYFNDRHADKALKAYETLLEDMRAQNEYSELSDKELKSYVNNLIEVQLSEKQGKEVSLEKLIKKCSDNSFEKGFFVNWDGDTVDENELLYKILDIDNADTNFVEDTKKVGGHTTATLAGAAAGAGIGAFFGPIGAGIGAGIGAVVGFISSLF